MVKQASNVRKRLRRFLTADPGRFAGGSAVSDPLGLLAVERERQPERHEPNGPEGRHHHRRLPAIGASLVAAYRRQGARCWAARPQTREPGRGLYGFDGRPGARP